MRVAKILLLAIFIIVPVSENENILFAEEYPAIGICLGNGVRLRDAPGTNSKVIGGVNESQKLILLEETNFNGDVWYKVEHNTRAGTAWIIEKYIEVDDNERTPAFETEIKIFRTFGLTPDKTKILLGKPVKILNEKFIFEPAGNDELNEEIFNYDGCSVRFVNGNLRHIEISNKNKKYSFGNIKLGDTKNKLLKILGKPSDENAGWSYEISHREVLFFEFDDKDNIIKMSWDEYLD